MAVVSDIHGNITGMNAVLKAIDELGGCDVLVAAGDIVSGGSASGELMKLLIDRRADIIRGNVEDFLADPIGNVEHVPLKFRRYIAVWRDWLSERLSPEEWRTLTESPLFRCYQLGPGNSAYVCHASPRTTWDRICSSTIRAQTLREAFGGVQDRILVYGHFHNHHVLHIDGRLFVNVAGVGLRNDGMSCFSIIEGREEHVAVRQYMVPFNAEEETRLDRERGAPVFEELVES